jgi:hypothetical protein
MVKIEALSYVIRLTNDRIVKSEDLPRKLVRLIQLTFDRIEQSSHHRDHNINLLTAVGNVLELGEEDMTLLTTENIEEQNESDSNKGRIY